ncbi:MAG: response regulator [Anaerolineae bacterium]
MEDQKLLLVVEDVPGIRELLELTLRFKNYEVVSAVDGQEALQMMENRRPAAVVTDILMPRMDGFSLLYHLRKDEGMRDIPVVFLSATYVSPEDKDFARTLGAARFIEKPIDIEKFLHTIQEVLDEPPVAPPPLLKETEFLQKYQIRLDAKLEQKNAQIARAQRLLQTATPTETTGFEASLRQALHERQAIEVELDNVQQILQGRASTQ